MPKSPVSELTDKTELTREQFEGLLGQIDKGLRALPATAQVGTELSCFLGRFSNKGLLGHCGSCCLQPGWHSLWGAHTGTFVL